MSTENSIDKDYQNEHGDILKLLHGRPSSQNLVKFENTYRMEPVNTSFFADNVSGIIRTVLEDELKEKPYDCTTIPKLALTLSDRIKEKVKQMIDLPRHKLLSFVTIGEMKDQGVRVGSRCIWNPSWDRFASASYKSHTLFAVGVVFVTYFE